MNETRMGALFRLKHIFFTSAIVFSERAYTLLPSKNPLNSREKTSPASVDPAPTTTSTKHPEHKQVGLEPLDVVLARARRTGRIRQSVITIGAFGSARLPSPLAFVSRSDVALCGLALFFGEPGFAVGLAIGSALVEYLRQSRVSLPPTLQVRALPLLFAVLCDLAT